MSLPHSVEFAEQTVEATSFPVHVGIYNGSGTLVAISSVMNSNPAEFGITFDCAYLVGYGYLVPPGGGCSMITTFAPSAAGPRSGTITMTSSGIGSPQTIALSGTGITTSLSVPASYAFAAQTVGVPSASGTLTISNTSGAAVTVFSVTSSNAAEFAFSGSNCTGLFPPSSMCFFDVTFTPSAAGAALGNDHRRPAPASAARKRSPSRGQAYPYQLRPSI